MEKFQPRQYKVRDMRPASLPLHISLMVDSTPKTFLNRSRWFYWTPPLCLSIPWPRRDLPVYEGILQETDRPVRTIVILSVIFGRIAALPSGGTPYPLMVFAVVPPSPRKLSLM